MSAAKRRFMPETRERRLVRMNEIVQQLSALTRELAESTRDQLNEGTLESHQAAEPSDMLLAETDLNRIGEFSAEQREIAEAIERIEAGIYGCCQQCGTFIDPTRLEVLPTARRFHACQQRLDNLLSRQQYERQINFEKRFAD